jgi:hypothetical protein
MLPAVPLLLTAALTGIAVRGPEGGGLGKDQ